MNSEILRVAPDGKLDPPWNVVWKREDRLPLIGTATHIKHGSINKFLVRFKHYQHWVKETQLEF